ncbi:MAG: ATP synthase F0 subunit B [Acidobacteriota bacterium]
MSAIQPDLSIALVMILVWGLYFVLKQSFFGPISQILSERQAASSGAQQSAQEKLDLVTLKTGEYQGALKSAHMESYRLLESERAAALAEQGRLLAESRQKAERSVSSAKSQVADEIASAKKTLEAEVDNLAEGIVRSILR